MDRQFHGRPPFVNSSLFNPEWVYGVRGRSSNYAAYVANENLTDDVSNSIDCNEAANLASVLSAGIRHLPWSLIFTLAAGMDGHACPDRHEEMSRLHVDWRVRLKQHACIDTGNLQQDRWRQTQVHARTRPCSRKGKPCQICSTPARGN